MTNPASLRISSAASLMAGPLFTASLLAELVLAGVLSPTAATVAAAARLAAASAAAVAAGGLAGSCGKPAADAGLEACRQYHSCDIIQHRLHMKQYGTMHSTWSDSDVVAVCGLLNLLCCHVSTEHIQRMTQLLAESSELLQYRTSTNHAAICALCVIAVQSADNYAVMCLACFPCSGQSSLSMRTTHGKNMHTQSQTSAHTSGLLGEVPGAITWGAAVEDVPGVGRAAPGEEEEV